MKENTKQIYRATWIGIIANLFLAIIKGLGGFLSGSKALIADALHSASDIVSSVVILFAVRISNRPPDKEHPYGHGKAENIASMIVALLLVVVGIEISISSAKIFFGEVPTAPSNLALIIIIISIVLKEVLFQYKIRLGRKHNSTALISDAWHHRSDSLSSIAVLIGVGAAILGEKLNLPLLVYGDAVAGIIVSIIVIKVGYDLAKESSIVILEKVLSDEDIKKYQETILSIKGINHVDELLARTHGSYVIIDLKVSVDSTLNVREGHDIGKAAKTILMKRHPEVSDVFVHINPYK
ncbi:MAG TPA: cation diffusion facilitator family transporter [Pseudogracilibacillus sp.]|nr:cation diffusion facilitator family transporter [Pseudogracilibacillus sp.]